MKHEKIVELELFALLRIVQDAVTAASELLRCQLGAARAEAAAAARELLTDRTSMSSRNMDGWIIGFRKDADLNNGEL